MSDFEIMAIEEPKTEAPIRGFQLTKSPQEALTASTGTLANAVIRIGEIEQKLINLGLLKPQ